MPIVPKIEPKPELPKEEADFQERSEGFNKELTLLLAKYELGLAATAKITGDGRVAADPIVLSARNLKKPGDVAKTEEKGNEIARP